MAPRWTAIMVGIPFVVVTSYILYQRGMSLEASVHIYLVLIKPQWSLDESRSL